MTERGPKLDAHRPLTQDPLAMRLSRNWFGKLAAESRTLLVIGVVFGGLCLFVVPPFVTFDGPGHLWRAAQVARGGFRAERYSDRVLGGLLPGRYGSFVDSLWGRYWGAKNDFGNHLSWSKASVQAEAAYEQRQLEFTHTGVYSPINYLFQGIGIRLAELITPSPLIAEKAACLFNLLGYLLIVILALERLPNFRRGLLLVATSPMLFTQAASVSADTINFSLPVLLLAWVAYLRFAALEAYRRGVFVCFAVGLLVVFLKPTAIALIPIVVLIPTTHFGSIRRRIYMLAAYAFLVGVLWLWWNKPYLDIDIARWFVPSQPSSAVMKAWFLEHPMAFCPVFANALISDPAGMWFMFYDHVGGWAPEELLQRLRPVALASFIALFGCAVWRSPTDRIWALGLFLQSIASLFLIGLTLWLSYGVVGATIIPYFSGRYFPVVFFALSLAWAELVHGIPGTIRRHLFWVGLGANLVSLSIILFSIGSKTI